MAIKFNIQLKCNKSYKIKFTIGGAEGGFGGGFGFGGNGEYSIILLNFYLNLF